MINSNNIDRRGWFAIAAALQLATKTWKDEAQRQEAQWAYDEVMKELAKLGLVEVAS